MRAWLYVLLGAVALAAAVLSFAALRDLALLCGFATGLAWLLPVVVDAGAAAGTLVWLGGRDPAPALRFARRLALTLLCGSIFANGLSHGVAAYRAGAPWWVVIVACVVSGAAPAVLGAVVHLVALRGRVVPAPPAVATVAKTVAPGGEAVPAPVFVPLAAVTTATRSAQVTTIATQPPAAGGERVETWEEKRDRLLAEKAGRKRLAKELAITEYEARQLLAKGGDPVEASA